MQSVCRWKARAADAAPSLAPQDGESAQDGDGDEDGEVAQPARLRDNVPLNSPECRWLDRQDATQSLFVGNKITSEMEQLQL